MVGGHTDAGSVDVIVVLLAAEAGEPDGEKRKSKHPCWESADRS